jgi:hypothetical protein
VRTRTLLVLAILLGAALRLYPLWAPYLHPEQDLLPKNALDAFVEGHWRPRLLHHGAAVIYALRTLYAGWYAVGHALGWFQDRLDLLAAFVRDPLPLFVLSRLFVATTGILAIPLAAHVARRVSGSAAAGVVAAFLLAVTLIHVRGSHHIWQDVPAGTVVLATVAAALRAQRRPGPGAIAWTAALAGLALACKHNMFPVALVVLVTVLTAASGWRARLRAFGVAGLAAAGTYLLVSPYTLLAAPTVFLALKWQAMIFAAQHGGLDWATLIRVSFGYGLAVLAGVGLVAGAVAHPRAVLATAAFPAAYLALLSSGSLVFARYLAPLAPFVAIFAGIGATALGRLVPARFAVAVTAAAAILAGAQPLRASLGYDRVLAARDTRQLAGDWLRTHVAPGTPLTLHTMHEYSNPVLPVGPQQLARYYPAQAGALRARGLGTAADGYPARYLVGIFNNPVVDPTRWVPSDRWVVLARPARLPQAGGADPTPFEQVLRRVGATPVARFPGIVGDPQGLVYDPVDADFTPLAGFEAVARPGPDMTIWSVPAPAPSP